MTRQRYALLPPKGPLTLDTPPSQTRRRTSAQVQALKAQVASLRLRNTPYAEIARQLNISPAYAQSLYHQCVKEWNKAQHAAVSEHRAVQLAKLDQVEREAWQALKKLQEEGLESVTVTTFTGSLGTGETHRKTVKTGSPADILAIITKCLDMRAKLLGLYSPERIVMNVHHQQDEQHEPSIIDIRLAEYQDAFARARIPAPESPLPGNRPGQPLDSGQAPPETGPVPDTDG
jgi:hypothetical protein